MDGHSLEHKIKALSLKPMDDKVYFKYLRDLHLQGIDVSKWEYYVYYYNDHIMFYSEAYLKEKSLSELEYRLKKCKDLQRRIDDPTIREMFLNKYDSILLKLLLTRMKLKAKWNRLIKYIKGE